MHRELNVGWVWFACMVEFGLHNRDTTFRHYLADGADGEALLLLFGY